MKHENNGKQKVYVAILTPYLSNNFAEDINKECDGCPERFECIERQKGYGYDPKNFNGIKNFNTRKHVVLLETRDDHSMQNPALAHFAVAGNTMNGEREVWALSKTGLLIARYSTFYPNESGYTGSMPGDVGYSLDIPKKVPVVKAFITDDAILDALVSREEAKIRAAVKEFNKGQNEPVLVTPFLEEALSVRK